MLCTNIFIVVEFIKARVGVYDTTHDCGVSYSIKMQVLHVCVLESDLIFTMSGGKNSRQL